MPNYPYVMTMKRLESLLKKISKVGIPNTVDRQWLASVGFNTSNDRRIIGVLEFIGFIGAEGKPRKRWNSYRDKKKARKVIAESIMAAYGELFTTYPNAHEESFSTLGNFFRSTTNLGTKAISLTVGTFKTLCGLADFTAVPIATGVDDEPAITEVKPPADTTKTVVHEAEASVTVNINIQITLPEGADEKTYDKFFAAMAKHLPLRAK